MTREIKFRAWDDNNKIMHYDFQFKTSYLQTPIKIMQYTGLKDIKRKEIYEWDVITTEAFPKLLVKWSDEYGGWCVYTAYDSEGFLFSFGNCVIIGNRFENPWLMCK